jgi:hypothetical protein
MIDFIGLGAQKSGTSWVYACLYEHPKICAPIKEIHFFSRERFSKGRKWYEDHFKRCKNGLKQGEFSTSYLYSKETPQRIKNMYPHAKLIAILRNPVDRAISQYRNAIKAGEIDETTSFNAYAKQEPSSLEQGLYVKQIKRYLEYFPREQMLILIYEDTKKDPAKFIKTIYEFLGVDPNFIPSMLHTEVNVTRTPKNIGVEKLMHTFAESLRKIGFDKLVHMIRKTGIPDMVRGVNTKEEQRSKRMTEPDKNELAKHFVDDAKELSGMLDRDVTKEWGITG